MPRKVLTVVLAALLIILLVSQAVSLFVFPVPDSIRWFGDESWLMTESIATVKTGRVNHPHALSSTLAAPKAFLPVGAAWIRTALYGVPGYLLYPEFNPVHVGRVVTWILSLALMALIIGICRKRTRDWLPALIAGLALASTLSFFFSSHSARPDLLKGLIILAIASWVSSDRFANSLDMKRWMLVTWMSLISAIWLPFHLYFHLIAVCGSAFLLYRSFQDRKAWGGLLLGVIAAMALTAVVQYVFSGELLLSGPEGHKAEFSDVTRDIPILRILSLSAQLSVFERRIALLWQESPIMFLLIPSAIYALWQKRKSLLVDENARFLLLAFSSLFVWYFLQRIHPAYTIQMLPLFIAAAVISLHRVLGRFTSSLAGVLVAALASYGIYHATIAFWNGAAWTNAGVDAVSRLREKIELQPHRKPLVMVEASANMPLLADTSIRLMTTHFQFFPIDDKTIEETLNFHGVDYAVLYNTAHYGYDRNAIDPLVQTIKARADLVTYATGWFFDIGKDYFDRGGAERDLDTLFLYKLRK